MVDKHDADLNKDTVENEDKNAPQVTPSAEDSATISMQGVSGKVITGKVKVKKVKPSKKQETEEVVEAQDSVAKEVSHKPDESKKSPSPLDSPMPRKISSGQVSEKKKEELSSPAEEEVKSEARAKEIVKPKAVEKAEPKSKKVDKAKPSKLDNQPQPKKLGSIFDSSKPRKISSGEEVQAAPKVVEKTPSPVADKTKESKPRTEDKKAETAKSADSSKNAKPVKQEFKGPRKISSGGVGPRKISSAAADDSLAATARAFARSKEEKQKEKEDKAKGGRTRFTGRRNERFSRNKGQESPFDKDKDEDDNKFQSQPRRQKKKTTDVVPDPKLTRAQDGKNKFTRRDDKQTRFREFSAPDRSRKANVYNDLREDRIRKKQKRQDKRNLQPAVTHVSLPSVLTVKEFAEAISRTSADVITSLMKNGIMATQNQEIDFETAAIIAEEFGVQTSQLEEVTMSDILFDETEDEGENLQERPPVVSVMGHVDHGKTSLLDYIRSARVASGEAGGITQRIGAYMTEVQEKKITFLDTPGHEAFTTMRARGAQATDMAILVVAADDGVMPQTIEAINHAKAAGTEIIVAINKMDRPNANPDRVKQELAEHGVISEEWGGSTVMVPISAKTGEGIEDLLEMLILSAEVLELRADPDKQAKGIIIEAQLDKNRGPVATLLVQRGTLRQGDTIVANTVVGNVRAMVNADGEENVPAGPSVPVEVLGLPEVPEAGTVFYVVDDEKMARAYAEERRVEQREAKINRGPLVSLDNLFSQIESGKVTNFNIVIKADVVGSVEAMSQSLEKLSNDEVKINIIHAGAGAINETDLRLAEASNATVIGFNVRPNNKIMDMANELGVEVRQYTVIYHAIEEVESAMKGMLKPVFEEVIVGHVEIRETFQVSSIGTIGGAYVTDGKIFRNSDIRVLRDDVIIHTGTLASLRRYENDVREVAAGYECGLSITNYNDLQIGDRLEVFEMQEVERK